MSVQIPIKHLTREQLHEIETKCIVQGASSTYNPVPKIVAAYEPVIKECFLADGSRKKKIVDVIIPIQFANAYFGKAFIEPFIPESSSFPKLSFKFTGKLYEKQIQIQNELIQRLKDSRTAMVNVHCGGGKCMGIDTPVTMADGSIRRIDSINVGEHVMGDNGSPREVTNTAAGVGPMMEVCMDFGEKFKVTIDHQLSLIHLKPTLLRDAGTVIDVSAINYYHMAKNAKEMLSGIRVNTVYPYTDISDSPYRIGYQTAKCEGIIPHNIMFNSKQVRAAFLLGCIDAKRMNFAKRTYDDSVAELNYTVQTNFSVQLDKGELHKGVTHDTIEVMVPSNHPLGDELIQLSGSLGIFGTHHKLINAVKLRSPFPGLSLRKLLKWCAQYPIRQINPFIAEQSTYQLSSDPFEKMDDSTAEEFVKKFCDPTCVVRYPVKIKSIRYIGQSAYAGITVTGNQRYITGNYTVTHNTVLMMSMLSKIRYKSIVMVSTSPNMIIPQWINAVSKFTTASAAIIKPGMSELAARKVIAENSILIMNIANVTKFPKTLYEQFGVVVVDECHAAVTSNRISALHYVSPRYLIALTGTMDRTDGMYELLWLFVSKPPIVRELNAPFDVFKIKTNIVPEYTINHRGRPDWNSVLNSIADNPDRNSTIANLIHVLHTQHNRHIIVLSKRKTQVHMIRHLLKTTYGYSHDDIEILIGSQRFYNGDASVLLSTYSKTGVGFDHPKLDTLIIATDVSEQIEQYVGRIFRKATPEHLPWVFDFVDKMSSLEKHWKKRALWYTSHGACIIAQKDMDIRFPEFHFLRA